MNSIFAGADPSARKKGFAMCFIDYSDRTVIFKIFKDYLGFLSWFLYGRPNKMVVCVENSNLQNKFFYSHRAKKGGALLTPQQAKFIPCRPLSQFERDKANRDVGKNMFASQIAYNLFCTIPGYTAIEISPKQKGAKWDIKKNGLLVVKSELRAQKLTICKDIQTLTQDEVDSFQIALKGKQMLNIQKIFKK